jgi:hypothetical protein
MSLITSKSGIPKFSGKEGHFRQWRLMMKMAMKQSEIFAAVEFTDDPKTIQLSSVKDEPNRTKEQKKQQDKKDKALQDEQEKKNQTVTPEMKAAATMFLITHLEYNIVAMVMTPADENDPAGIWNTLNDKFDRQSLGGMFSLQAELWTGLTLDGKSISEVKTRIDNISATLARMGERVTAFSMIGALVMAVKRSTRANGFALVYELISDASRTKLPAFDEVARRYVDKERELAGVDNSASFAMALYAGRDRERRGGQDRDRRGGQDRRCYNCGSTGHLRMQCDQKQRQRVGNRAVRAVCTVCNKFGEHTAAECYLRVCTRCKRKGHSAGEPECKNDDTARLASSNSSNKSNSNSNNGSSSSNTSNTSNSSNSNNSNNNDDRNTTVARVGATVSNPFDFTYVSVDEVADDAYDELQIAFIVDETEKLTDKDKNMYLSHPDFHSLVSRTGRAFTTASTTGSPVRSLPSRRWCVDSGATSHMVNTDEGMTNKEEYDGGVRTADGTRQTVNFRGTFSLAAKVKGGYNAVSLKQVLYTPWLSCNLLSVSALTLQGYICVFTLKRLYILAGKKVVMTGTQDGQLFYLDEYTTGGDRKTDKALLQSTTGTKEVKQQQCSQSQAELWHQRFGHLGMNDLDKLVRHDMVTGMPKNARSGGGRHRCKCKACALGKITTASLPKKSTRTPLHDHINAEVSTDTIGKITPTSYKGDRYIQTFLAVKSGLGSCILMKHKSQASSAVIRYLSWANTQHGSDVKRVRGDGAG